MLDMCRSAGVVGKPTAKAAKQQIGPSNLPPGSLAREDFEGEAEGLVKRSGEVASKVGANTLIGRIRSAKISIEKTVKFSEWWDSAGGKERLTALTDRTRYDRFSNEELQDAWNKISKVPCPFRGNDRIVVSERKKEKASASDAGGERSSPKA
jgi:hypothetical protein